MKSDKCRGAIFLKDGLKNVFVIICFLYVVTTISMYIHRLLVLENSSVEEVLMIPIVAFTFVYTLAKYLVVMEQLRKTKPVQNERICITHKSEPSQETISLRVNN